MYRNVQRHKRWSKPEALNDLPQQQQGSSFSSSARLQRFSRSKLCWPLLVVLICLFINSSEAFSTLLLSDSRRSLSRRYAGPPRNKEFLLDEGGSDDTESCSRDSCPRDQSSVSRRGALLSIGATLLLPPVANAASHSPLEDLSLGNGQWKPLDRSSDSLLSSNSLPPSFCSYAARFLINYDTGVRTWWNNLETTYSLLSPDQQRNKLGRAFGSLAKSVELALDPFIISSTDQLYDLFVQHYGPEGPDAMRQIAILFCILPPDQQPINRLRPHAGRKPEQSLSLSDTASMNPVILNEDLTALLPQPYCCVPTDNYYSINPPISLYQVGIEGEFGQTVTATAFGPLAAEPLIRENPNFAWDTYALLGISGATGCALTHATVIPLDVVKTRCQTDPESYDSLLGAGVSIARKEGISALLLGAEATIAGYFWYGLSVYPSYTFFKRFLAQTFFEPQVAAANVNEIALVAGAIAAVIASLGLTPIEAARIRAVAEPDKYKPLGLLGTLDVIAKEDPNAGWKTIYAGLPSLLTRQVIFGSVKFLAFERACEFIFALAPVLRDATWTSLGVSLVAGGFSGALSSVVSQPADSVLTYVAQNSESSMGVIQGCRVMIEQEGVGSLFRGLGSRVVWAASIIAGQFLLYDVFRTYFGVSTDDLSQVYQVVLDSVN